MLSRSERHWQILISEYKACRTKLQSKREAHQILLKMLSEHDQENKAVMGKLNCLETTAEEIISGKELTSNLLKFGNVNLNTEKGKNIVQSLLLHVNKVQSLLDHKTEQLADLTIQNSDLKKDLKALRADKSGLNRVIAPVISGIDQNRDDFLSIIQSLKEEVKVSKAKIKTLNDEATDFRIEREFYKQRVKTLTEQLHEKSECQPIAEVEQLLVENRELRDKVDKLQHVNAALVSHNTSFHEFNSNYYSGSLKKRSYGNKSTKHVTFKVEEEEERETSRFIRSVKEKVKVETELQHLQRLIQDMQKVSNGLAETVLDKNTALKHQRASNRLLGERVTELEAKLRALEMSGFWNVPEGCSGSGDEDKRNELRRLTLTGESSKPKESADLLLDHSQEESVAIEEPLLLCENQEPWETNLADAFVGNRTSPEPVLHHYNQDSRESDLVELVIKGNSQEPLVLCEETDCLLSCDATVMPVPLMAKSDRLYCKELRDKNQTGSSDDLTDLLPVKEGDL